MASSDRSVDARITTSVLPTNAAQETGGNLATVNANTAPLIVSTAGGYVRQDSTATIALETGGNLAQLVALQIDSTNRVLTRILAELRIQTFILNEEFAGNHDIEAMRAESLFDDQDFN